MPDDPLDLAELERLARAATPGPWTWNSYGDVYQQALKAASGDEVMYAAGYEADGIDISESDAAYIAAFDPPTALRLLAELRRLREVQADDGVRDAAWEAYVQQWHWATKWGTSTVTPSAREAWNAAWDSARAALAETGEG